MIGRAHFEAVRVDDLDRSADRSLQVGGSMAVDAGGREVLSFRYEGTIGAETFHLPRQVAADLAVHLLKVLA